MNDVDVWKMAKRWRSKRSHLLRLREEYSNSGFVTDPDYVASLVRKHASLGAKVETVAASLARIENCLEKKDAGWRRYVE